MKAYRREVMETLPTRPDWHRYMVVMAAAQGFAVTEIPVPLYPRNAGKSKFATWHRIPIGVLDMLAVWFELRFGQKPLLLFGMLGVGIVALSVVAGIVLLLTNAGVRAVWQLARDLSHPRQHSLRDRTPRRADRRPTGAAARDETPGR